MFWWRIEALKARLAVRPPTDRESLPYVVANGTALYLTFSVPPENPNGWDTVTALVVTLMFVVGVLWVYRQNGGATGRDFLHRYFSIGWVTSIRLLPVFLVAGVVAFVSKGVPAAEALHAGPVDVLLGVLLAAVYYQRVGAHVRDVAQGLPSISDGSEKATETASCP